MANYPKQPIPLGDKAMTISQAAIWYLRIKMVLDGESDGHLCPVCGEELHFQFCEVYGDPYSDYVMVSCKRCKISSDACYYPRYNVSPIDIATGAIQRAIVEFERRVKK